MAANPKTNVSIVTFAPMASPAAAPATTPHRSDHSGDQLLGLRPSKQQPHSQSRHAKAPASRRGMLDE